MIKGKYIVIEGPEGVGKTTQILELSNRLQAAKLPVRTFREPDSQTDLTARAIRTITQDPQYPMNTTTEVLLYNAARSQSLQIIKDSVEHGVFCIADRNYLTNLAIQYYGRGDIADYETINRIIKFAVAGVEPDLTIVLDAPVPQLLARLEQRSSGERYDNFDAAFLERVRAGYLWEANQRNFPVVFADADPQTVSERIWKYVTAVLAIRNESKTIASEIQSVGEIIQAEPPLLTPLSTVNEPPVTDRSNPSDTKLLVKQPSGGYKITAAGREYLDNTISDSEGNVYAFNNSLPPSTVAAAMARLSRRGDDLRLTLLDEFATDRGKDNTLLKRIITAYGDDSVQQLTGIHLVVENASNLLTKKLEWGRLAAYLEQSTRYIYFDQKDNNNNYRYYIPTNLKGKIKTSYKTNLDKIFSIYSELVHQLTNYITANSKVPIEERDGAFKAATRAQACDAIRVLLPAATTSTVGLYASGQAVESLIMHLRSDELLEARLCGDQILKQARQVIPMFLERADKPERGGANSGYMATNRTAMQELSQSLLNNSYAATQEDSVTLVDYWPKNEMDLIPDMLYEHSSLPLKTIKSQVEGLSYEQKEQIIKTYAGERLNRRQKPGRALEKAHYSWDILCDYGIFRDLQRHRIVDDLGWQKLSPRFGYEIPKLVEAAGLSERFEECFDISLKLYSELQAAGYSEEAQYATLLGHRVRWKVTYNAREAFHIHELRTSPQGHPGYRKLVNQMHELVAQVHPLLAGSMIFVNQGEDPELTRLAAERYSQNKLTKIKK